MPSETSGYTLPEGFQAPPGLVIESVSAIGGMGTILRARETSSGRIVALKVLKQQSSSEALRRFESEARLTAKLEHPNIVPVHAMGSTPNKVPFYTMKFVRGKTLRFVLEGAARGDLQNATGYSLPFLLTVFQKVCDAVSFAHGNGVLHRDLKPDNIMLGDFGEVLVMDWGIAKKIGTSEPEPGAILESETAEFPNTLDGQVLGSPHYMSPEQARGENQLLDARADIHALGAILYHMVMREPHVSGRNHTEILNKIVTGTRAAIPLQDAFGKRIPESLRAIIRKATAFDAAERYSTIAELQADLAAYQTGFATRAENAPLHRQLLLLVLRHKTASTALALILTLATGFSIELLREKNTAVRERQRAEKALASLIATAPEFLALSRALLAEARLDEALEKSAAAVELDPSLPDARLHHALLLQSSGNLAAAVAQFEKALEKNPGAPEAAANIALCRKLLAEPDESKRQRQLLAALREQNRLVEAAPLSEKIEPDLKIREAALRARLHEFTSQPDWSDTRITLEPDGTFAVDLSNLAVGSLAPLEDQPVTRLHLENTDADNLAPLSSLPLRHLTLKQSRAADLSPLSKLPIEYLDLTSTPVRDVSPLAGMPLRHLVLDNLPLAELPDVQGMPLEHLSIRNTIIFHIDRLRGLPLRTLIAAAPHIRDLSPLADLRLEALDISQSRVGDLAPLSQMRTLRRLDASGSRVFDLKALSNLPLAELDISNTNTTDLAPLSTVPLQKLRCDNTRISDVRPLASVSTLKEIVLPHRADNIESLRHLPLERISSTTIGNRPALTASEYWVKFDEQKSR
jgi:serine/threonine protein kinase